MTHPDLAAAEDASADRAGSRWSVGGVVAVVAVSLVFLVVVVGIVLAARPDGGAEVHTIEIPAGTGDRIDAGEDVTLVPRELELSVNDTIMIENHDDRTYHVGPFVVTGNETLVHRFDHPGRFQGTCEIHPEDTFTIIVS